MVEFLVSSQMGYGIKWEVKLTRPNVLDFGPFPDAGTFPDTVMIKAVLNMGN